MDFKIQKLEWLSNDWENIGYIDGHYIVKRIDIKSVQFPDAKFMCDQEADRVIKLWNATNHLSDHDLNRLCDLLINDRNQILG